MTSLLDRQGERRGGEGEGENRLGWGDQIKTKVHTPLRREPIYCPAKADDSALPPSTACARRLGVVQVVSAWRGLVGGCARGEEA